jgi:hypothetical protein
MAIKVNCIRIWNSNECIAETRDGTVWTNPYGGTWSAEAQARFSRMARWADETGYAVIDDREFNDLSVSVDW